MIKVHVNGQLNLLSKQIILRVRQAQEGKVELTLSNLSAYDRYMVIDETINQVEDMLGCLH